MKAALKKMSAKSLKLFGPPTTKCKGFAKLNGNHFFMANIFKVREYQTFGLMKMHNMSAKSDLPITYSVCLLR